ncbi:MAG: tRNA (N6-isopentenyl adenosine(37)-C2)-methylthiotransferase MiaB [Clostridia bacterium]|nr:tRNA (N6-isopentenyl adenosine(37)-C2)-methylthiotransferase MiaB [Clostridia bacterium]
MRKFHISTFGCQMNEHDSEIMAGLLLEAGYEMAKSRSEADIVIFNTCSIRENADKRFFGTLGQLKKTKMARKDDFTVCVCGCMPQQKHITDTIKAKYPWVDIVFGTHNIERLPALLANWEKDHSSQIEVLEDREAISEKLPACRLYRHKSYVNITYGCDNFCTYCIVPYTRGREKSRSAQAIIGERKDLVADGVKEVMLLGQNVNSYSSPSGENFADLIREINDIDGLERIRFMTSHPKDLSDDLIKCFLECDKLCKYLHLPVQAGSNGILKRMNRKYTREHYLQLVKKLREAVPDITLSTDIIVGFPGESDEDFKETLDLVNEVGYDSAFTFLYSIRKGTPAEKYKDQIPEDVKHERFDRLVEAVNSSAEKKNAAYVGRVVDVMVDGFSKNNHKALSGRTDGFKLVNFEGDSSLIGQIVKVKIIASNTFSLEGELV